MSTLLKLTPVLFVDLIEPCLPFWVERFGFTKTVEVPDGDHLSFVILTRDNIEVMYQTRESLASDVPGIGEPPRGGTYLFMTVSSIDDFVKRADGLPLVVPFRKTSYGSTELGVREPGGSVVVFAEMTEP